MTLIKLNRLHCWVFHTLLILTLLVLPKVDASHSRHYNKTCEHSVEEIYNGDKSQRQFPFMVAITRDGSTAFCAGALLDNRNVVTAAHCIPTIRKGGKTTRFVIGATSLTSLGNIAHGWTNCYYPSVYPKVCIEAPTLPSHCTEAKGDIAVCRLDKVVTLTKSVNTICVSPNRVGVTPVTLIGFGNQDGLRGTSYLQHANGATRINGKCNDNKMTEAHICADLHNKNKKKVEQAKGDSGGPLFTMSKNGKFSLVGTVSYNANYKRTKTTDPLIPSPNHPGVYARASSFLSFLKQHANVNTNC